MGVEYQFEIRFSGEGGVGYVVDVLNGTRAIGPCYWVFYVLSPVGLEYRSNNIDISTYHVPDNYSIVLRYEKIAPNTYTTLYTVEHPDPFCTNYTSPGSIAVTTPRGSSALNVMEQAVRDYGSSFSFSTSYVGTDVGYTILQINDIKTTSECSWVVFVTPSGGVETRLTTSLSLYIIPTEDHRLTLRFMEPVLPTTLPTAATTSGTKVLALGDIKWRMCKCILFIVGSTAVLIISISDLWRKDLNVEWD